MSLRGKHCFKTEVLQSKDHHGVNASQGSGYANGCSKLRLVATRDVTIEILVNVSYGMLGPSLPRSCPAVLYKLGTSSTICNACTCIFVKLFRNC